MGKQIMRPNSLRCFNKKLNKFFSEIYVYAKSVILNPTNL